MPLTKFDPPGFLDDLDENGQEEWSKWIGEQIDSARNRNDKPNDGPRPQFFNPLTDPPGPAVEQDISWTAFPRIVKISSISDKQRWRQADSSRDVQDEYCEWSVTSNPDTDKITRITFTCEGPEYWEFLAAVNPDKVVELYQKHVNPNVVKSDLFHQGNYVRRNKWNNSTTNGAMHLIQRANTLGAEIELAAAATLIRQRDGKILTQEQDLIQCGAYGEKERNSDPHIGGQVNSLARQKADITLANPVGLYIEGLSVAGWETPDSSNPLDYWKIVRGTEKKALRAVFEVPPSKTFTVGDIEINGQKIDFGGQIADFINIKLSGLATRFGDNVRAPVGCVQQAAPGVMATGPRSVKAVLGRPSRVAHR